MDLSAMNKISYGLFVLAARDGEKDNGCIINTVIQVTAAPNRIAFAVNKSNYTHDIIQKTKLFTVSVLDESARFGTFQNFGFQSGRTAEKFAEIEFARGPNGIAYLTRECCAWISGRVSSTVDLGTHTKDSVDYPDIAALMADAIKTGKAERGILLCGTGIGISIAANRFPFIRAALVHDAFGARLCRRLKRQSRR